MFLVQGLSSIASAMPLKHMALETKFCFKGFFVDTVDISNGSVSG